MPVIAIVVFLAAMDTGKLTNIMKKLMILPWFLSSRKDASILYRVYQGKSG